MRTSQRQRLRNVGRKLKVSRQTVQTQLKTIESMQFNMQRMADEKVTLRQQLKDAQTKPDTTMIDARTKLAAQLGQTMEAFAHGIGYILGEARVN